MGGFMTLHNNDDQDRYLVAASSPAFTVVELHCTEMVDGMATMIHQSQIRIPAHGQTIFKPMDYHLMMIKPRQMLKDGDRVPVTLSFKNGDSEQLRFLVKRTKMSGKPMHHNMKH